MSTTQIKDASSDNQLKVNADGSIDANVSVTTVVATDVNVKTILNVTSTANSTTTPLGSNGVFTGAWENVTNYTSIMLSIYSDKSSATNGIEIDFSSDGVHVDTTIQYTYDSTTGTGDVFVLPTPTDYFRIKYTNGSSAQTAFRMQVTYGPVSESIPTTQVNTSITDNSLAATTRSVIVGKSSTGGGNYVNVKVTPSGAITNALGDISGVVGQNTMANSLPVAIANNQTATPWALQLDNTSTANVIYVGIATVGSATSSAVWQIKKIDQTTGLSITWAGSAAYNQIWDNRTSLVYS